MYSTCLFCNASLGRNDAIEHFPVGRRLAFDAAKGRLWVVCTRCARWNLTPIEERWEAIEECERGYRGTRARVSTDQVGLARLREGIDLVRIGKPLRPEFAAWRYGAEFERRRRRTATVVGTVGAAAGVTIGLTVAPVLPTVLLAIGVTSIVTPWAVFPGGAIVLRARDYIQWDRVVARVSDGAGSVLTVRAKHLRSTEFEGGGGDSLRVVVPHDDGQKHFEGQAALTVAAQLLSRANAFGATSAEVRAAVDRIERAGDARGYVTSADAQARSKGGRRFLAEFRALGAFQLNPIERLAFEMAAHEEAERRALEGELAILEAAWRDADEIAGIADAL